MHYLIFVLKTKTLIRCVVTAQMMGGPLLLHMQKTGFRIMFRFFYMKMLHTEISD